MSENESARDHLARIYDRENAKMFAIIEKYVPYDEYEEVRSISFRLWDLANLLSRDAKTDEELEKMRYHELHIHPNCPKVGNWFDRTIPHDGKPLVLDKLCEMGDCEDFDSCWCTRFLNEPTPFRVPTCSEGSQKDWTQYRKDRYARGEPCPTSNDKEWERKFYEDAEREYNDKLKKIEEEGR